MPANRHRRRVQAARARYRMTARQRPPRGALSRIALGVGGAFLLTLGALAIANPRGYHTGRGLFFLVIVGCALLVLAVLPQ